MKQVTGIALAVGCLIVVSGCGRASEKAAEKMAEAAIEKQSGGKADVDISGGTVKVKTKDGEMVTHTGKSATIPSDFPADVFVPKDGQVLSTVRVPQGFMVMMETRQSVEDTVQKYGAEMKAKAWAEEASVSTGEGMMLAYAKEAEGRKTHIMVLKGGKTTQLQITVVTEKKGAAAQ